MIGITEAGDPAVDSGWEGWTLHDHKPTLLITKDPGKLHNRLSILGSFTEHILIHCTITGYGETLYEPKVPSPTAALDHMKGLADWLGQERVILRVDPIIPTLHGVVRAQRVMAGAINRMPDIKRVRISFMDNYKHNHHRWRERGVPLLPYSSFHAPLQQRQEALAELQKVMPHLKFEVCGEPGMPCAGCLGEDECILLGVTPEAGKSKQRAACNCLALKKQLISRRKPCMHDCCYCYWKD